jgi:hypothetical protein
MRFGSTLRDKALLVLEEAVQEARYRVPRRSFALRFALAYLWSVGGGPKEPFNHFWCEIGREDVWRFRQADQALECIYRLVGVERDPDMFMELWRVRQAEERRHGRP